MKETLKIECAVILPIVKLSPGHYLVGTQLKSIQVRGSGCFVRTSKGCLNLDGYLKKKAKSECFALNKLCKEGDRTLKQSILTLLERHRADSSVIVDYEKKY